MEFKRRVVEATLLPGASVALIAREHEVNANLVFKWRRHYREGQLGPVAHQVTLLPVNLSKAPTPSAEEAMPLPSSPGGLVVECGRVTLRIEGVPDPQTLQLVLQQMLR
ncbi:IS66-like element accessory protein TnpA [Pseudomonas sediminis]|uniref:IS66-like element accessory protein TnpA n=1 Tax=Pseudomonas sediminis TaxID=1691904 RepID=UPI003D2EAE56